MLQIAHCALPKASLGTAGPRHGQQERQGGLAFAKIIPGILAQIRSRAAIIEHIISQLKRQAQIKPIIAQGLNLGLAGPNHHRPGLGRRCEQFSGLGLDDLQIGGLIQGQVV